MYGGSLHSTDEFLFLHDVVPCGALIGTYLDHGIHEFVVDSWGRHYQYAGIIWRGPNGQYDRDRLEAFEFILKPGIIYRMLVQPQRTATLGSHMLRWWTES